MNKRIKILVFLLLIIIVFVIVISYWITKNHVKGSSVMPETEINTANLNSSDKKPPNTNTEVSNTETSDAETSDMETSNASIESETTIMLEEHERSQYDKVIMVGDSRFSEMSAVISHPACEWICKEGGDYDWLSETAASLINNSLVQNCAIVLNLGVNDPDNANKYIEFLNSKVDVWVEGGADIYFMTVNPVDNTYNGKITNNDILDFNNTLMANLSEWVAYIDTSNALLDNGYETTDGLHYDRDTYIEILEYCLRQLRVG